MGGPGRRRSDVSAPRPRAASTSRLHRGAEGVSAERIAMRQKTGSVGTLLDHTPPKPIRDHARDNVRALRELQRTLRERKEAESKASAESPFKLRQFESVPSRLHLQAPPRTTSSPAQQRASSTPSTPSRSPFHPAGFGSCVSRGLSPRASAAAAQATKRPSQGSLKAPAGPCSPSSPVVTPVKDRRADRGLFGTPEVHEEKQRRGRPKSAPRGMGSRRPDCGSRRPAWGHSPIKAAGGLDGSEEGAAGEEKSRRQLEYPWGFEAEDVSEAPVPPGFRLISDAERLETLEELRRKLVELDLRYSALPLRIETEGHIRQQNQLRSKIEETENAVMLFSRPKVLLEM
eukprot:TRINITY_DN49508_c0_g1_i1.p1 TRINITY_DN49508_c0_g1~~TRINITY_DN49508_c0_g1_i1.p1  ORF type:complete len:345 (+),score=70.43 TRINITY_DN49508_c0_g1_i1:69-1103(+)